MISVSPHNHPSSMHGKQHISKINFGHSCEEKYLDFIVGKLVFRVKY